MAIGRDKTKAVGACFCQIEHPSVRFDKNGDRWWSAMTKQGRQSSFLPNRAPGCSIWQKQGQEVVGHDKMKVVGLDLAKVGDRRWSAVFDRYNPESDAIQPD